MNDMPTEGRRHPRVKVSIHIEWGKTPACEFRGDRITSLSAGGCFIQTERGGGRGDTVFLRLWESPNGEGVLRGRVIYQFGVGSKFPPIGVGVEFVGLGDEDAVNLESLLDFYNESPTA